MKFYWYIRVMNEMARVFLRNEVWVQIIKVLNLFLQYCFGESISYSFYFTATSPLCFHGLFLPLGGKCLRTSGLTYLPLCLQSLADCRNSEQVIQMKNLDFILYIKEYYNKSCVLDVELYKIQSELARVETGVPMS